MKLFLIATALISSLIYVRAQDGIVVSPKVQYVTKTYWPVDTPRYEYFIKMNATTTELQRQGYIMDSIMQYHGKSLSVDTKDQHY